MLAYNITNKFDVNDFSLVHLTFILSLHFFAKFKNRSLAVYNNELLSSACVGSKNHCDHKIIRNLLHTKH